MSIVIRPLAAADREKWLELWRGYQRFYEADLSADEDRLFAALVAPAGDGPFALVAEDGEGRLVGLTHFLFHATTWSAKKRCYLNDLFTAAQARGQGVGEKLIEAVCDASRKSGIEDVYWLTQTFNATARRLYDRVASETPFIKYSRKV
jgi:GNAT superfamily N-acetyltransferase